MRWIESPALPALEEHFEETADLHMRDLFEKDPDRFQRFSLRFDGILLDYSKNRITQATLPLLCEVARTVGLEKRRDAMFSGERINKTEGRSVLHVALRRRSNEPILVNGEDVLPDIKRVLKRMGEFTSKVRSGEWKGFDGRAITDVVNIGIGGSDLGPQMVVEALKAYSSPDIRIHFVSNVDGTHLAETLRNLEPSTTLFVVTSKSFTTLETMTNARTAREWFLEASTSASDVARHFVAVSTNEKSVREFGIDTANMFEFWDWVGGRFSLWSAVGLSIALAIGMERFEEFLEGAYLMDEHFRQAPFESNMPVILGLLGFWYVNFFGATNHVVVPYDQYLHRFPAYLQQLDMESNGKRVDETGRPVSYHTGPMVWGEPGTNGQHAFFQLLHQGTEFAPVDFIIPANSLNPLRNHHQILLANCFAQSEALMRGKSIDEAAGELEAAGAPPAKVAALAPHKEFPGNRPSNTMLLDKVTPRSLGSLLALYEHKIFVQGVLWGIDSFDQWGVQLGKELAQLLLPEIEGRSRGGPHDASTAGLLSACQQMRKRERRR